jgi:DNA-binding transcriptional ArsR family regulator
MTGISSSTACDQRHVEGFGALAHGTRLHIVLILAGAHGAIAAGAIQEQVGVPAPTLSHHLNVLRVAGLITSRRKERHVYYSVRRDQISELVSLLVKCSSAPVLR